VQVRTSLTNIQLLDVAVLSIADELLHPVQAPIKIRNRRREHAWYAPQPTATRRGIGLDFLVAAGTSKARY
jgi:hypothetical protein